MEPKRDYFEKLMRVYSRHTGIDISNVDMNELRIGMEIEKEHGSMHGEEYDVTGDDGKKTFQIAMVHLLENPKYYTILKQQNLEENTMKTEEINSEITKASVNYNHAMKMGNDNGANAIAGQLKKYLIKEGLNWANNEIVKEMFGESILNESTKKEEIKPINNRFSQLIGESKREDKKSLNEMTDVVAEDKKLLKECDDKDDFTSHEFKTEKEENKIDLDFV